MSVRRRHAISRAVRKSRRVQRPWPALVGDGNGTIEVPGSTGLWYVRPVGSDMAIPVYKGAAPRLEDYPVWVGQDIYNRRWVRILGTNLEQLVGNGGVVASDIEPHAGSHYLVNGSDPVYITTRQVTDLLLTVVSGMTVRINGGFVIVSGQPAYVSGQNIDLTSNIPGSGALWGVIRANSSGVLSVQEGTGVSSFADLTTGSIPEIAEGFAALWAVRLYDGQTAVNGSVTGADYYDLRFAPMDGGSRLAAEITVDTTNFDGILSGTDDDIQTALETIDDHTHSAAPVSVVTASITNPPTDYDIIAAFGDPATAGAGFIGMLYDSDGGSGYMVTSDGASWWYKAITKATSLVLLTSLASDTFTGSNGTGLDAHTMDTGAGWTEVSGTWTIESNATQNGTTSAGGYIAVTDVGSADFVATVRAKITNASGNAIGGLIFRYQDTTHYWIAQYSAGTDDVKLGYYNGGAFVEVDSKSWDDQYQGYIQIDIIADGNDVTAHFDGGYELSGTDATLNDKTKVGLFEYRDAGGYSANTFDNFQAVPLRTYPITVQGTAIETTVGTDDEKNDQEPSVIIDTNAQILSGTVFKMWYTHAWSSPVINYAESTDGITWTKYSSNPVISGYLHAHVVKVGSEYWFYGAKSPNWDQYDLYTSTDGISWSLDTEDVIPLGAEGQWDDGSMGNIFVWQESAGDFRAMYEATNDEVDPWAIGYATSSDGKTWTKYGSNPVLNLTGMTGGQWLKKVGDYYYMWVHQCTASHIPTYLARYRSSNLTTWTPWPSTLEIPRIGSEAGEDTYVGQTADPFIVEKDGTAYIYYEVTANGLLASGHMIVKVATMDARGIAGW